MRLIVAAATAAAALAGINQAAAQTATASPTPEAAAKFIDTVLGNGVAKVGRLPDANNYTGLFPPESSQTADCKTVVRYKNESYGRGVLEIDWRTFVAANSFFNATVTDRWGVRALARTSYNLIGDDGEANPYSAETVVGVMLEPGTEELKDRLIRAVDFYGKSCAPKLDGPF
jgi:hypothetical protein